MPRIRSAGSSGVKADIDISSSQFRAAGALAGEIADISARKQNAIDQGGISKYNNEQELYEVAVENKLAVAHPDDYAEIIRKEAEIRKKAILDGGKRMSESARNKIIEQFDHQTKIQILKAEGMAEIAALEESRDSIIQEAKNSAAAGTKESVSYSKQLLDDAVEGGILSKKEAVSVGASILEAAARESFSLTADAIDNPNTTEEALEEIRRSVFANEIYSKEQKSKLNLRIDKVKDSRLNEADTIGTIQANIDLDQLGTSSQVENYEIPSNLGDKAKKRIEDKKNERIRKLKTEELTEIGKLHRGVMLGTVTQSQIEESELIPDFVPEGEQGITKRELIETINKSTGVYTVNSTKFKNLKSKMSKDMSDVAWYKVFSGAGDADLNTVKKYWKEIKEGDFDQHASNRLVQYGLALEYSLYADGEVDIGNFWFDREVTPEMQNVVRDFTSRLRTELGGDGRLDTARISADEVIDIWEEARTIINAYDPNSEDSKRPKVSDVEDSLNNLLKEKRESSVWNRLFKTKQ